MTSYYVTGSLSAFARMVKQRKDAHAQLEIQDLANKVEEVIKTLYPTSWAALMGEN
jgi:thymidylate synthase (FAD)